MIISLNASIFCAKEPCGQVVSAIICPAERTVTQLVALGNRQQDYAERLVPINLLSPGSNHFIDLACSETVFNQLPLFNLLPFGAINIQSRTVIQAQNGRVGVLSHLILEPSNNRISHLIMQYSHFRKPRQIMIPIAQVQTIDDSVISLNIDKPALTTLPTVCQKPTGFHIPYPA